MRLIDADALKETIDNIWDGRPISLLGASILAAIDHAPTIDPKAKVIAQVTFDEDKLREIVNEEVERIKEEYDITDGWIPCSERLPIEEKKTYWVCTDTEYQCECRWTNNRFGIGEGEWGWSIFDTPQYSKPIAWMPLPEPYNGGEDE